MKKLKVEKVHPPKNNVLVNHNLIKSESNHNQDIVLYYAENPH